MPSRKLPGYALVSSACCAATSAGSCCQMLRIPVAITISSDASRYVRASASDGELPSQNVP